MANIKPFKAVRPANEYVKMVAELPYDGIINGDEQLHLKTKENVDNCMSDNIFIKDNEEAIYIYRKIVNDRVKTSIIACIEVDNNINGVIKKYEHTKLDKDIYRVNHIRHSNEHMGTALLTYKNMEEIEKIMDYYVYFMTPIYDFKTDDGIIHTVWKVEKERDINDLVNEFTKVENLYIEDDNGMYEVRENIALEERRKNPNYTGKEEYNYYTGILVANIN